MDLTEANKQEIDDLSYEQLLFEWRFAPIGDRRFQGETGEYWGKRMAALKEQGADHVDASKRVGWEDEQQS